MRRVFLVKMTHGPIQQRYHITASAGFHKPAFSTYKRTLMPVV